jgi:hypothetical protein
MNNAFINNMTSARWLVTIIAVFIALTWFNHWYFANRLQILAHPTTPEDYVNAFVLRNTTEADEYHWFVGREAALVVVAIGGLWALYRSDVKRRSRR